MDIRVGDKITLDCMGDVKTIIITTEQQIEQIKENVTTYTNKILKIERPKYEVVEEKKELLTEEEKEFLKQYIKIIKALKNGEIITICRTEEDIKLKLSTSISYKIEAGPKFGNMKMNIDYTLQELGLEES